MTEAGPATAGETICTAPAAAIAALVHYLDRRVSSRFLPAHFPWPIRGGASGAEPGAFLKSAACNGETGEDDIHLVVCAHPGIRTGLLNFTDDEPEIILGTLLAALATEQIAPVLHVCHLSRVRGSARLCERRIEGLIFLRPATLAFTRRVAHAPRGVLAGWRLYLVVPLSAFECELARRDVDALFAHFEAVDRDLLSLAPRSIDGKAVP